MHLIPFKSNVLVLVNCKSAVYLLQMPFGITKCACSLCIIKELTKLPFLYSTRTPFFSTWYVTCYWLTLYIIYVILSFSFDFHFNLLSTCTLKQDVLVCIHLCTNLWNKFCIFVWSIVTSSLIFVWNSHQQIHI